MTGTAPPAALRVVLVDDEHLIRSALATMLSLEEDLEVLGEAGTVAEGARLIAETTPDIAVVDLQLPDGDGLELCEQIAEASPATRCLILTSHARPGYLKRALAQGVLGSCRRRPRQTARAWVRRCGGRRAIDRRRRGDVFRAIPAHSARSGRAHSRPTAPGPPDRSPRPSGPGDVPATSPALGEAAGREPAQAALSRAAPGWI